MSLPQTNYNSLVSSYISVTIQQLVKLMVLTIQSSGTYTFYILILCIDSSDILGIIRCAGSTALRPTSPGPTQPNPTGPWRLYDQSGDTAAQAGTMLQSDLAVLTPAYTADRHAAASHRQVTTAPSPTDSAVCGRAKPSLEHCQSNVAASNALGHKAPA
jgi:hypothetical protein